MAIELRTIAARSPTRLRLKYSAPLGAGAYSVTWFSLVSLDSATADPPVVAAMLVSSASDEIELALSVEMAPGGSYELTSAAGIPAADASVTLLDVTDFRPPVPRQAPSLSVSATDAHSLLFGEDLLHDGNDMVETHDGDLATISGEQNAVNAVIRRALSDGLPYAPDYGPHLRRFIDGPSISARVGQSDIERNARLDDRVKAITAELAPDDNSGDLTINASITLIGGTKRSFSQVLVP